MQQQVEELNEIFGQLGTIERDVLLQIADRLRDGQFEYGAFDEDDARSWEQEGFEETLDLAVYMARGLRDAIRRRRVAL